MAVKKKSSGGGYNGSKRSRRAELHAENKRWNEKWWRRGHRGWLTTGSTMSKTAKAAGGK